jgi:cyclohexanecarboxylate-CoA ligase
VRAHAIRTPNKVAIVDAKTRITYGGLANLVDQIAMGFVRLGVRPRDAVSIQLPNCIEFSLAALAVERVGAVVNPISTIMREREVLQMVTEAESRLLIVPDRFRNFDHLAMALSVRALCPTLVSILVVGEANSQAVNWESFVNECREEPIDERLLQLLQPTADDVILVAFTSGTTGVPKGVMHTVNTLEAIIQATVMRQGLDSGTVVLMPASLGHGVGYYWGLRMPLTVGGTSILQATWDPHEALRLIEDERVTFMMASPPFLADLVAARENQNGDISSFGTFICGGASIAPVLVERATGCLPCRVLPCWGMTENGIASSTDPKTPLAKVLSTDGSPHPGVELRIVDADFQELDRGREGRLLIRGPLNFVGYSQGRSFTESYFPDDDWFETGDLGYVDQDRYLRITGRTKDIIIRGGENIPVKEIEDALSRHPAVRDVVLVAIPDERLGERACACVVCYPGKSIDLTEIQQYLASKKVAKQFWPELVQTYEALPRTPSGKVVKFALREELARKVTDPGSD